MRQNMFEYCDHPGKQLARVLSEIPRKQMATPLQDSTGSYVKNMKQKLQIFQDYFQELYKVEEIDTQEAGIFLGGFRKPVLSVDYIFQLEGRM